MGIAEDIIIILIAGLLSAFIAHKLKLPLLVGYIIAGIVIGPFTGGVTVTNVKEIELLAEIGVGLLLFSIGLELSLGEIREVRTIALIGTPLQILLSAGYGIGIGHWLSLPWTTSILLGAVISLSSTMIVIKTLMSRGLMGTLSSRVMIGMLIVQDLAAVPMMIIIPQLDNIGGSLPLIGLTLLKGVLVLAVVMTAGNTVIPFIMKQVARLNSPELFLLAVVALGLGTGYATHLLGLSFALGAFVTGLVLNRSDYGHKALHDIIPLRDVFGLLFFTSVGMLVDPSFLIASYGRVLILSALVIAGKFIIFAFLARGFGYFNIVPIAVGLGLSQVGEFSFVLARLGLSGGVLSNESYSLILTTSVVTMLASPLLSMLAGPFYAITKKIFPRETIQIENMPPDLRDHVIIAGGGRVGTTVADILHRLGYLFVVVEQDFNRFESSKGKGFPVIYGDACQESILSAAGIESARLIIITVPSIMVARDVVGIAGRANPRLNIVARSNSLEEMEELRALNVHEVVQPEFEASLEMIRQTLLHLDIPALSIQKYTDDMRRQNYSPASGEGGRLLSDLKNATHLLEMEWLTVGPGSPACGKSIAGMKIRTATGATVVGVYRSKEFTPNPEYDFIFQQDDVVAVIGRCENRKRFEAMINPDAARRGTVCEQPGGNP